MAVDHSALDAALRAVVHYPKEGVTLKWYVHTLWKAAEGLPVEKVRLSELENELMWDRWFQGYVQPSVRNVIKHFKRIEAADLSYPIILSPTGRVLDGMHRICRAILQDHDTIDAIRLLRYPPPDNVSVVEVKNESGRE